MTNLEIAKQLLQENGYTCVLCNGERIYTSVQRGVKPLVIWLSSGEDFHSFCAADRVIGKATAFLYVLLGVKAVYAAIISKAALDVLQKHGIFAEYDCIVENIINRQGNGICPFESAVLEIEDTVAAYQAIQHKMEEL